MLKGKCKAKPGEGVVVESEGTTLQSLELEPYFYRFSETAETVYHCPTSVNCVGGKINGSVSGSLCRKGSGE